MKFYANEGKQVYIQVGDRLFARHAIQTRFVNVGDDYIRLVEEYVLPLHQPGDLLSMSEKVIALCQGRIVREEEVRPGLLAKLLCRFVHQTSAGPGAGVPYKMQYAINQCGRLRVLWAAFRAAIDKLRGIKGTFYRLTGQEVSGLDGFYGSDIAEYEHMGIQIPREPDKVCDEILQKTGVRSMVVDANELGQEILGAAHEVKQKESLENMVGMIADNPAGQDRQFTPFILIREIREKGQEEWEPADLAGAGEEGLASPAEE